MMKLNENNVIPCEVITFIIPNSSIRPEDCYSDSFREKLINHGKKLEELNENVQIEETERFVQLWFHSKDLGSENIADHGFRLEDPDGETEWFGRINAEYLPKSMLRNVKEGDIINVKFPVQIRKDRNPETTKDIVLDMQLKCSQEFGRYRAHGKFHELLPIV